MSHDTVTRYLEDIQERFEEAVSEDNWAEVNKIRLELEQQGLSQEEITLINSMHPEAMEEYTHYQKKLEGEDYQNDDLVNRIDEARGK